MFDLDAVGNEAEGIPFHFTFGGEKYQLPAHVDMLAAAAMAAGDFAGGLMRMMGEEQWARMCASPAVFDQAKLEALLVAYKKHTGADVGESGASTGS